MYKEMLYAGEQVIAKMEARILPYDKAVPDCVCSLVATKRFLAVLEDNFDGTYEEHYKIYVSNILSFGCYKSEGEDETLQETESVWAIVGFCISALVGDVSILVNHENQNERHSSNVKYLKLAYKTYDEKHEALYFDTMNKNPNKILKAINLTK